MRGRLKIVHVCPDDYPSSGVNGFCTRLSESLNERFERLGGLKSLVVRGFADLSRLCADPDSRASLVLHIHGLWLRDHHRAAVWARRHGVSVVWSTHGMTAPWSLRHKRWKKILAWWLYQRRDLGGAVLLHATSEQEIEWNRRLGLTNRQVLVPLGTNEKREKCGRREGGEAGKFTVLFVGRVHPVKGLVNLVRAAALVRRRVAFRIVGPDEVGHLADLRAECARLGVEVCFAGEKHGDGLKREYANCDALVLPSFTENFGGVVVDALAHGKPVIASRATPWRILEEAGCGWWTENSPEMLAKAIDAAAGLPREELEKMGERGRRLVDERFTWAAVARKMAEEYEKCED